MSLYVTCSRFRREAFQAPKNYYCELLAGKASQAGFLGLFKKNEKKKRRSPEKVSDTKLQKFNRFKRNA